MVDNFWHSYFIDIPVKSILKRRSFANSSSDSETDSPYAKAAKDDVDVDEDVQVSSRFFIINMFKSSLVKIASGRYQTLSFNSYSHAPLTHIWQTYIIIFKEDYAGGPQ